MRTVVNNNFIGDPNNNFYALAQTTAAGAAFILKREVSGYGATGGIVFVEGWAYNLQVISTITDNSAVNFTFTGLDEDSHPYTETITGSGINSPSNTSGFFSRLFSVTTDIGATNVSIGLYNAALMSTPFYMATGVGISQWALELINSDPNSSAIITIQVTNYPIKNLASNPSTTTTYFNQSSVWTPLPYLQFGIDGNGELTYLFGSGQLSVPPNGVQYISQTTCFYALRVGISNNSNATGALSVSFTQQGTL